MCKATAVAGANIAFIKYWGHADPALNVPLNDSISMTLDNASTVTTVEFSPELAADSLCLNDQWAEPGASARASAQLDRLRRLAGVSLHARVESRNSFPIAAGIASSAAGFAALTVAGAAALGLDLPARDLSRLARLASGSACRSLFGGYVLWHAGAGDADSFAEQLAPPEHWPLVDIVAVVSRAAKDVPSEAGHRLAGTSPLLPARLAALPAAVAACRAAICERDFDGLGRVAEADALSLHAIAMTSQPAALYWEPGTISLLHAIHGWRKEGLPVYFTIDAGPNVHVLTLPAATGEVRSRLQALPDVQDTITCEPGPGAHLMDQDLF